MFPNPKLVQRTVKFIGIVIVFIFFLSGCEKTHTEGGTSSEAEVRETEVCETEVRETEVRETKARETEVRETEETAADQTPAADSLTEPQIKLVRNMLRARYSNHRYMMEQYGYDQPDERFSLGYHWFRIYRQKETGDYFLGFETAAGPQDFPVGNQKLVWDEGRNSVHIVEQSPGNRMSAFEFVYEGTYQILDTRQYIDFPEKEEMTAELWQWMLRSIAQEREPGRQESYTADVFLDNFTKYDLDYLFYTAYNQETWFRNQIIGGADYDCWKEQLRGDLGWEASTYYSENGQSEFEQLKENGVLFINGKIEEEIYPAGEALAQEAWLQSGGFWGSALDAAGQYYRRETGGIDGPLNGEIYLLNYERSEQSLYQVQLNCEFLMLLNSYAPVKIKIDYDSLDRRDYRIEFETAGAEEDEEKLLGLKFDLNTSR